MLRGALATRSAPAKLEKMSSDKGPNSNVEAVAVAPAAAVLREDLIEKAIGFLTHPKVADTSLARKRDFLREKKGMTEAEINEAVRRAGATDEPQQAGGARPVVPMAQQQQFAKREERGGGVGLVGLFAGTMAVAAAGVAAYYGFSHYSAVQKKKKKDDKKLSAKKKSVKSEVTPVGGGKKKRKSKEEEQEEEEPVEVKELQAGFQNAIQAQADEYAKRMQEVEKLLKQIEENNKQKFELMKPNDDLKNDIQTIKQLLLTRQASALVVDKEKEEASPEDNPDAAASLASSAPGLTTSGTPVATGLKPWEQRRRARIDAVPGGVAAAPSPVAPVSNSSSIGGGVLAPSSPPPNTSVPSTPVAVGGMEEEK